MAAAPLTTRSLAGFVVAVALGLGAAHATAQPAAPAPDVATWADFRALYNAGDYPNAIPLAVEAIQLAPHRADYYLGLARALFWGEQYETAVFYYDVYLTHFGPGLPASTAAANRPDRVRQERESANQGRPNPAAPVAPPATQDEARTLLDARLVDGVIVNERGGGAWAIYQGLLRSGYARPDLPALRAQLAQALHLEATTLVPTDRAMMPALSEGQWQAQRQRLAFWMELDRLQQAAAPTTAAAGTPTPPNTAATPPTTDGRAAQVQALIALTEGQQQYLNMNWENAQTLFTQALTLDPALLPAHVGRLNALYRSSTALRDERSAALTAFQEALRRMNGDLDMALVYQAAYAAQDRDDAAAAQAVIQLLGLRR